MSGGFFIFRPPGESSEAVGFGLFQAIFDAKESIRQPPVIPREAVGSVSFPLE